MIPNLAPVQAELNIYRGGHPTTPRDYDQLVSLGITQIIQLCTEKEGNDEIWTNRGLMLYKCPIDFIEQIFIEPTQDELRNIVAFITPGTFIHCGSIARSNDPPDPDENGITTQGGNDRTGLVVACHRIWNCGWDIESASREMMYFRFHLIEVALRAAWHKACRELLEGSNAS